MKVPGESVVSNKINGLEPRPPRVAPGSGVRALAGTARGAGGDGTPASDVQLTGAARGLAAIEQSLPEEHQSLGTRLDITHIAATPVGMRVRATAEVVRVEGRTVYLKVAAHDERELIGEGTHERVVVNVARFDKRVQEKLK